MLRGECGVMSSPGGGGGLSSSHEGGGGGHLPIIIRLHVCPLEFFFQAINVCLGGVEQRGIIQELAFIIRNHVCTLEFFSQAINVCLGGVEQRGIIQEFAFIIGDHVCTLEFLFQAIPCHGGVSPPRVGGVPHSMQEWGGVGQRGGVDGPRGG
jgi:hypothetical protein